MLRIHDDMLDALRLMRGLIAAIERRDTDLARQLRRAGASVVLNLAEGCGSFGRVRTARYRTALRSARETLSCLRVAEALGYVEAMPQELLAFLHASTASSARWCASRRERFPCARARSRPIGQRGHCPNLNG